MKQTSSLAFLFLMLFSTSFSNSIKANDFPTAGAYLDYISNEYKLLSQDLWDYTRAASRGKSARKVEKRRKELIATTTQAKNKIKRMPAYEGDTSLRDTIVSFLEISNILLREDYAKIVDLEEIAEQSYDLMEAYLTAQEQASEKQKKAGDMVDQQYDVFAAAHNITLIETEDKISKKLEQSGKVIKYHNIVYLIFFKSFKQEAYLMDALSSNDINAIEQNRSALISVSEEGLEKIKTVSPFESDNSMILATNTLLKAYISEANNEITKMTDFNLEMEKFDKTKATFDAIKPSKRTQKDVNNFNNAVNNINNKVKEYNTTQKEMNKKREVLFANWQKASDKFMDRHIP